MDQIRNQSLIYTSISKVLTYVIYMFSVKVADSLVTNKKPYFKEGTVIVESILTINDVKLENAGLYTCKSVSRFDQSKSAKAGSIINVRGTKRECFLLQIVALYNYMMSVKTEVLFPTLFICITSFL